MERHKLLWLIDEAAADQHRVLNLAGLGLTELPTEIGKLVQLEKLILGEWNEKKRGFIGNYLTSLPPEIEKLVKLQEISIDQNLLTEIPDCIAKLPRLNSLSCEKNKINVVPSWLGEIKHLRKLNLGDNGLSEIPDWILAMTNLTYLGWKRNGLEVISESIGNLHNLTRLGLGGNVLPKIPAAIFLLTSLKELYIWQNKLTEVPKEIGQLQSLTGLNLSNNQISKIPAEIGQLQSLINLDLSSNQISEIPKEIGQFQNLISLNLSSNQISEIPEEISQLQSLISLELVNNRISEIPEVIGQLQNLTNLELINNRISEIPEVIGQLQSLTNLELINNKISEIPEAIGQLHNLTNLELSSNQISKIPEAIGQLHNLTNLDLSSNQISEIPQAIRQLQNLNSLYLNINKISGIPRAIRQLQKLTRLSLGSNQLREIPESISQLQSLTRLSLSGNQISKIPESISQLQSLTRLSLRNNQISEIPESISQLQSLTNLNLYGNQITKIPQWMQSLDNLESLDLRGNPIPIEPAILGPKEWYEDPGDLQTILSFYFQSQDPNQSAPLYEAKFIIVGEGAAGKTTLVKKIQNPNYKLTPTEKSTDGIDVIHWEFTQPNGHPCRVNIWDFGGQEILHATHQFFLTARSLYTLVIDDRRENPNLYYWLNIVRLLSDNSPIFIIKNEKQNCQCTIDEGALRKEFHNLQNTTISANFATDRGLTEIKKAIEQHITNLPHIHNPIPNSYTRIRAVLENYSQSQNYISAEQYYELCRINNIKDHQEQLNISQYLHDLGICLHFQQDPILKHLLILNPIWATNAVYKISSYEVNEIKVVAAKQGRFTRADLQNIWSQSNYTGMHAELLQLMQKFGICYPIRNTDTYIAPSLLPQNQPIYDWNQTDNLILSYQYEFMPRGIITRFIVETHDLIEVPDTATPQNQLVWKNGVILNNNYARAEIIENYDKKEISIRVAGLQPKSLLENIRREFRKIHDSFHRLDYAEMIPCNCDKCNRTQTPHAYKFKILQQFLADRQSDIQCQKSYKMVNVRRLLHEFSIDEREIDRQDLTTTITPNPPNIYINNVENMNSNINPLGHPQNIQGDLVMGDKVMRDKIGTQINNATIDQSAKTSSSRKSLVNSKKIIRIVVASPGDVQTERDILADKVIPELNKGIAKSHNLLLEIDRWETDTHPGFHIDGPQGLIDEILEIDRCDILIGIFWKRFGSPIKSGETGTEHEFMTAYQAWQQQGTPEIMMYFKEKDFLPTKQDLAQYTKVLDFKENFPAAGLYWKFQDEDSFESTIRQHLTKVVNKLASC
jgi:Leucine-rich repeat (LRR) protein/GTPase SAR1 family protein